MTALRALRPLTWGQLLLAVLAAGAVITGTLEPQLQVRLVQGAYLVVGLPTIYALWLASRDAQTDLDSREVWRDLGFAVGFWWLGDVLSGVFAIANLEAPQNLLVTDAAYLLSYPMAMRAMARFPGLGATRATRLRVQLDVIVACMTLATVFYWFSPIEVTVGGVDFWLRDLLTMTYPIGDGMLLVSSLLVLNRQSDPQSARVVRLLTAGFALRTLADMVFARTLLPSTLVYETVTHTAWLGWYGVISLAATEARALKPATSAPARRFGGTEWLPWICVTVLSAVLVWLVLSGKIIQARGVSVGMFTLLLTVLVRQGFVNREQRELDRLAADRDAEQRLTALVRHASELIMVVEADSTIRFVSASVDRVLGRQATTVRGGLATALVHPDDMTLFELMLSRVAQSPTGEETLTARLAHGAGGWRWMEMICTNRASAQGIQGVVVNLRDITERRELEGKLEWQAFHDSMTGLANRILFADRVAHALSRRERVPMNLGVLFIDLDHFKSINDTMGHPAGDAVLREVARRILHDVRSADTVARLGGDEFAVLLEDVTEKESGEAADRLLHHLNQPFVIDGREVFIGASIGVAVAEPGMSIEELVGHADVAMYVAKSEGRKRVVRFEQRMRERNTERLLIEADLRKALDSGELSVHYQPQVDLDTGEVLGAEALLRWAHPIRGMIPPSRFIPIAEQAGLVVELSRFVLQTACRDAAGWRLPNQEPASLHVAVNLSGRHLQDPGVVEDVRFAIEDAQLEPGLLTIEITESVMMNDTESAIAVLRQLKALNTTIAIDDFGTGYSSLSYLQQFPIDVLKIDKSFIDKIGTTDSGDALARAILSLGDALGLATVAEGIETSRQLEHLQTMGCLLGQGFLLCRPMPAKTFADVLAAGDLQRLRSEVPRRRTLRSA